MGVEDGEVMYVSFEPTDNPFFYDKEDRAGTKVTLEEEVLYEQHVQQEESPVTNIFTYVQLRRRQRLNPNAFMFELERNDP